MIKRLKKEGKGRFFFPNNFKDGKIRLSQIPKNGKREPSPFPEGSNYMKISILTATYNRAKHLSKLYESIVDNITSSLQIEWLIMDDGSTDETEKK